MSEKFWNVVKIVDAVALTAVMMNFFYNWQQGVGVFRIDYVIGIAIAFLSGCWVGSYYIDASNEEHKFLKNTDKLKKLQYKIAFMIGMPIIVLFRVFYFDSWLTATIAVAGVHFFLVLYMVRVLKQKGKDVHIR